MHSIQSSSTISSLVLVLGFPKLAPPSGLRGSCVEAIQILGDMLNEKDTCLQRFHVRASNTSDLTGVQIQ